MKHFIQVVILLLSCILFGQSCTTRDEQKVVLIDIPLDVLDSASNVLKIQLAGRYTISNKTIRQLKRQNEPDHKNVIVIPIIKSITRKVMERYSPGDIYNYKRKEVEQKIVLRSVTELAGYGIELTDLFIASVELPDNLHKKLEQEHLERVKAEKRK